MTCRCNNSYYYNRSTSCKPCNTCCDICMPINSPMTEYFSDKYHTLEYNYPANKCTCSPFGVNPRYYTPIHVPCNCKDKCYPC